MESQEIDLLQDKAIALRTRVIRVKNRLMAAQSDYENKKKYLEKIKIKIKQAIQREQELRSGRGGLLGMECSVKVYEFWLELPGYSGPIQGASAQILQHGSLSQVGDVTSKSKSGLAGGIVGGLLLGPVGAAAGVLATRKNEVSTQVREVDTRKLEFVVQGPGYAWRLQKLSATRLLD